jgi:hypothetical protein
MDIGNRNMNKPRICYVDNRRKNYYGACTLSYLCIVVSAIILAIYNDFSLSNVETQKLRVAYVLIGLFITLLPTIWWWKESWKFERWMYQKRNEFESNEYDEKFHRNDFEVNREFARAIWTSLLAIFIAFIIKTN